MSFLKSISICIICLGLLVVSPQASNAANKAPEDGVEAEPITEFVSLKPLIFPVISDKGLTQQISLVISLELEDASREYVRMYEPRLTDAYLQDMYGLISGGYNGSMLNGNILNIKLVKDRLSLITHRILGEDKVSDVLLQVVRQRNL